MNTILQPYVDKFELLFEGVLINTFESIQISEVENQVPAAQVTFIFNTEVLKILPGTIIQIFCNRTYFKDQSEEITTLLLFEGEVNFISFNYSSFGNLVTIKASSILSKMFKARMRPSHAVLQQEQWDAELLVSQKFTINSDDTEKGKKLTTEEIDSANFTDVVKKNEAKEQNNTELGVEQSKKPITGNFKELKNEGNIQNFLQAISEELAPSNNRPGSRGDYNYILQRFNREFEKNDLMYGLSSIGFKIGPSLLAFPNPDKAKAYHLAIFQKALNSYLQDISSNPLAHKEQYNLIQILEILRQNLHYKFLMPAAPFSMVHLNSSELGTQKLPIRMMLIPDFESGPPIKSNVFFPEQINNFNFQRDFINEASRLIASMSYASIPGMEAVPEYLNPIHVVPDIDIKQEKDKTGKITISSKLLFEETYKGVTLKLSQYDAALVKTLYDQQTGKQKSDSVDTKTVTKINQSKEQNNTVLKDDSGKEKEINDMLRIHALQDFATIKFGQRGASFEAEWSPYRIVGLPGAVMFKTNLSVVGIVQSVNTVISSKGQLQSSVSIRNARLIFDNTAVPIDINLIQDFSEKPKSSFISNHMILENSREGILGPNPIAFNDTLYSFDNIGKTLYDYINTGYINSYTKKVAETAIKNYIGNIINENDSSINRTPVNNSPELSFKNYTNLREYLITLKNNNNNYKDNSVGQALFQEQYNKRGLVTKSDYLNYLDIGNLNSIEIEPEKYCKHLYNILKGKTNDAEFLQKSNTDTGQKLLENLSNFNINYANTDYSNESNLYRIYNANRLAHVLNLKSYLKNIK